jgi:hypothetical protein
VRSEDEILGRRKTLKAICDGTRIGARVEVVLQLEGQTVQETIHAHSKSASLVFLGLGFPEEGEEEAFGQRLKELVEPLPRVVLVRNSGPFRGKLIELD